MLPTLQHLVPAACDGMLGLRLLFPTDFLGWTSLFATCNPSSENLKFFLKPFSTPILFPFLFFFVHPTLFFSVFHVANHSFIRSWSFVSFSCNIVLYCMACPVLGSKDIFSIQSQNLDQIEFICLSLTVTTSFLPSKSCFPDADFGFVYCHNFSILRVCFCGDHLFLPFPRGSIYFFIVSFCKYLSSVHCFRPVMVELPCELDWTWSQETDKLSVCLWEISFSLTEVGQPPQMWAAPAGGSRDRKSQK